MPIEPWNAYPTATQEIGIFTRCLKLHDTTKILWKIRYLNNWWKESFRWHDWPPSPSGRGLRCENSGEGPLLSACLTAGRVCRDGITCDFVVQRLKMMVLFSSSIQSRASMCIWYLAISCQKSSFAALWNSSFQDMKNDGVWNVWFAQSRWNIPRFVRRTSVVSKDAWLPCQLDFRLQCTPHKGLPYVPLKTSQKHVEKAIILSRKRGWCIDTPAFKGAFIANLAFSYKAGREEYLNIYCSWWIYSEHP